MPGKPDSVGDMALRTPAHLDSSLVGVPFGLSSCPPPVSSSVFSPLPVHVHGVTRVQSRWHRFCVPSVRACLARLKPVADRPSLALADAGQASQVSAAALLCTSERFRSQGEPAVAVSVRCQNTPGLQQFVSLTLEIRRRSMTFIVHHLQATLGRPSPRSPDFNIEACTWQQVVFSPPAPPRQY